MTWQFSPVGESKRRRAKIDVLKARSFPQSSIERWEENRCVAFAVALARRTGWLLHIDWLTDTAELETSNVKIPMRAYVGTDGDDIFDPRGFMTITQFNEQLIKPFAQRLGPLLGAGQLISRTRTYDDQDLTKLLHSSIELTEDAIAHADTEICRNTAFLSAIPKRGAPTLPAYQAGRYTWGKCVLYAHQLGLTRGLPVAALFADRIEVGWSRARPKQDGYIHSFVLHPDGTGEDSWGRYPVSVIAARYHVTEWHLDTNINDRYVASMRANSPAEVDEELERAQSLINRYASG